jgi:caa(3)-type oxidase subunit IV
MEQKNTLGPLSILATYVGVLVLLAISLAVTLLQPGYWHSAINLTIASLQAGLVMVFFMRLRWSNPLQWVVALTGFFFLVIMATFTLADFLTRGME